MPDLADLVDALLEAAENQHQWGGDEDNDGNMRPGVVDWTELRQSVRELIEDRP